MMMMVKLGYGVVKMAYSATRKVFGVCGNFRFKFYNIIDAQNTNSVVKTDMHRVEFVSSTNTSDNADNFKAQTLSWTGTVDANTVNELEDSSETFVAELTDLHVFATSGANDGSPAIVVFQVGDTDNLLLFAPSDKTATDLFPAGNETYAFKDQRHIILDPVTNDDDGTLLVIGE